MKTEEIHQKLTAKFGDAITALKTGVIDPWIEVAPASIVSVCEFLKSDPEMRFESLTDLTGADWLETDPKKKNPCEPHVEVVYHLISFANKQRCKLKVKLPRWKNGVAGQLPELPSVSGVWAVADWHEREAYDLVGIEFTNHPNMRRILCPEDWEGHPLRKDYEFPLEYHGVRGK
jgi:NADH-quinone oxidoreductase subunit C